MPANGITMRRIREVLRLKHECALSNAPIAAALGIAKGSVANYLAGAFYRSSLKPFRIAAVARLTRHCEERAKCGFFILGCVNAKPVGLGPTPSAAS